VLFVLYPNEAKDILSRVAESLGEKSAAELEQSIEQAKVLNEKVGDWAIAIESDTTLESAEHEAGIARELGYSPTIYLRDSWFVTTIGSFPNQAEAEGYCCPRYNSGKCPRC
jgi:hypothetical protein